MRDEPFSSEGVHLLRFCAKLFLWTDHHHHPPPEKEAVKIENKKSGLHDQAD